MNFELALALQFFKRSRHIGKYPILMIALSTALIIVIISIVEGFDNELISKLIGVTSHVEIVSRDGLGFCDYEKFVEKIKTEHSGVISGIAPRLMTDGILARDEYSTGVRIIGIDTNAESGVSGYFPPRFAGPATLAPEKNTRPADDINKIISQNRDTSEIYFKDNIEKNIGRQGMIIAGSVLCDKFKLAPGDAVKLTTLRKEGSFKVAGTFEIGIYDYDFSFVFCDIKSLQKMLGLENTATSILIKLKDISQADEFAEKLRATLKNKDIAVKTWKESNKSLFTTIKIERAVLYFIIMLAVVLANISVAFTVTMNVIRRAKSIAIMDVLGTSRARVTRVFFLEGLIFGVFGLVAGVVIGVSACGFLMWWHPAAPAEIKMYYSVSSLPVIIDPMSVAAVSSLQLVVLVITCLAAVRNVAAQKTLDILRNN